MVGSGCWFGCLRVVEQELFGYPEGMVGSGWWFGCPRVLQQELLVEQELCMSRSGRRKGIKQTAER